MKITVAVLARVAVHESFRTIDGIKIIESKSLETPFGVSNPMHIFDYKGFKFIAMARHGELSYEVSAPYVNDHANIWALKEMGVEKIISWSAPGAINEKMKPGDLVIIDDVLDETRNNNQTFFAGKGLGFVRQNPVFCPIMREIFLSTLSKSEFQVHNGGTYVATHGPRMETAAEIKKYQIYGGDLVGMTLAPEVFLARELEICYAAICYVVNYAEGMRPLKTETGVLFEGLLPENEKAQVEAVERAFPELILQLLNPIHSYQRTCDCPSLMERYRVRGDIGADWHEWIK